MLVHTFFVSNLLSFQLHYSGISGVFIKVSLRTIRIPKLLGVRGNELLLMTTGFTAPPLTALHASLMMSYRHTSLLLPRTHHRIFYIFTLTKRYAYFFSSGTSISITMNLVTRNSLFLLRTEFKALQIYKCPVYPLRVNVS